MPYNVSLPALTISTAAAPQSATWTDAIDDAESISFLINGTTTAPGIVLQGALTTSTGATFATILRPVDSTAPSAMNNVTSSGIYTMWPMPYRQFRFLATGLVTAAGGIQVLGTKAITV